MAITIRFSCNSVIESNRRSLARWGAAKGRAQNNFPICLVPGGRIAVWPLACVSSPHGCALHCLPPYTSKLGNYFAHVPKWRSSLNFSAHTGLYERWIENCPLPYVAPSSSPAFVDSVELPAPCPHSALRADGGGLNYQA